MGEGGVEDRDGRAEARARLHQLRQCLSRSLDGDRRQKEGRQSPSDVRDDYRGVHRMLKKAVRVVRER